MPASIPARRLILPLAWAIGAVLIAWAGTRPNPWIPGPQVYDFENAAGAVLAWTVQTLVLVAILRPATFGPETWTRALSGLAAPAMLLFLAVGPYALGSQPWGAVIACALAMFLALLVLAIGSAAARYFPRKGGGGN